MQTRQKRTTTRGYVAYTLRCEAAKRGVVTSLLASFLRLVDVIRMIRCLYYENVNQGKKKKRKEISKNGISLITRRRREREKMIVTKKKKGGIVEIILR